MNSVIQKGLSADAGKKFEERKKVVEQIFGLEVSNQETKKEVCLALIENFSNWLDEGERIWLYGVKIEHNENPIKKEIEKIKGELNTLKGRIENGEKMKRNHTLKDSKIGEIFNNLIRRVGSKLFEKFVSLEENFNFLEEDLELVRGMDENEKSDILEKRLKNGEYLVEKKWEIKKDYKKTSDYKLELYSDLIERFSERFDKICASILEEGNNSSDVLEVINWFKRRLGALKVDYGVLIKDDDSVTVGNLADNLGKYNVVHNDGNIKIGDMVLEGRACNLGISSKTDRGHVWYDYNYFVSNDCFKKDEAEKTMVSLYSNDDFYNLLGSIESYIKEGKGKILCGISRYYDKSEVGRFVTGESINGCDVWKRFREITGFSNGCYWIKNGDKLAILECSDEGFKITDNVSDYHGEKSRIKLFLKINKFN